jgi:hypothetical protein
MRTHLSRGLAVAISIVALLLAMAAGATAKTLITGKDIKNGTVTGKDIKNGSLQKADLSAAAQEALHGAKGAAGAKGTPGVSGYEAFTVLSDGIAAGSDGVSQRATCPTGKVAVGGGGGWEGGGADGTIFQNDPESYVDGVSAQPGSGMPANSWYVRGDNTNTSGTYYLVAYVICVTAN